MVYIIKTNNGLVEYAKAQLGLPYWMGTFGNIATEYLYKSNKARLPEYYTATDFSSQYGKRVHDCIGVIKGYMWSETATSVPSYASNGCPDHSADSMLVACVEKGTIDSIPEIAGILVFMVGHIGVYIGNGEVIEARGHKYGVVQTKLSERPWKHWGKCPYMAYDTDANMSGKEIFIELEKYFEKIPCPDWAEKEFKEAIELGITDGTNPCNLVPRYQAIIMANRAVKKAIL